MRKKLNKTDEEFQMFADYYKLYQDFYEPEDNEKYWESLINAVNAFYKKYDSQYARDLVLAFTASRETIWKSFKKS